MIQLSADITAYLHTPSTVAFLNSAKQVIHLLETGADSNEDYIRKLRLVLSELYFSANSFRPANLGYADDADFDRGELFKNSTTPDLTLLNIDFYWEVFEPIGKINPEPVVGSLYDDLSDIYKDLKIELTKIEQIGTNEAIEDACWQLHFGFSTHWGHHCIDALRVLHYAAQ